MSFRLKFAIGLSLLLHLSLLLTFWLLSLNVYPKATILASAGGVVWLNLNPGGSGGGGEGGLGAPKNAATTVSPVEKIATQAPTQKKSPTKIAEKKNLTQIHTKALPVQKKSTRDVAMQNTERGAPLPTQAQAWKGPGEGDEGGAQTGPSGGEGVGLGSGKGSGTGAGEGPGGIGPPGTGGEGTGGEGSKLLMQIRSKILNAKRYPRQARENGFEGISGLIFEINPDGSVKEVRLLSSSGYYILDDEALATVRRAAPFPYYPSPIRFRLRFSLKDED